MARKDEIEKASAEWQMSRHPIAMGGAQFADMVEKMNINPAFVAGAEWADKHPKYNPYKESILAIYKMFDKVDKYEKQDMMQNYLATIRCKCKDAIMYEHDNDE